MRGDVIEKRYRVSSWTRRSRKSGGAKKGKHGIKAANDDLAKDLKAGLDCVERAARSDWWNWNDGSRIMFGDGLAGVGVRDSIFQRESLVMPMRVSTVSWATFVE